MPSTNHRSPALLAALLLLALPREAKSYIDPATGSYFLQLFLAGLFAASFAIKMFWRNIRSYLRELVSKQK